MKAKDITGEKFGRLTAVEYKYTDKHYDQYYLCKCSCGNEKIVRKKCLSRGDTKSCGCLQREIAASANTTHNMTGQRFYKTYCGILKRCNVPSDKIYKNYGGRGIKCLWNSFDEFKDDMYKSYLQHIKEFGEKQTTIDRIDNDGSYCTENCRWATYKEQSYKKRSTIYLSYNNETHCLAEWADIVGLPYSTLHQRIKKLKWDEKKALRTPKLF